MTVDPVVTLPPNVPEAWIEQFKDAVKPKFLQTFFGSAVIAGVIGWASSYYTARMTIEANLELEKTKVQLQMEQDKARVQNSAYSKLATALDDLHSKSGGYFTLVTFAAKNYLKPEEEQALLSEKYEVGKAVKGVGVASSDPVLFNSTMVSEVNACLRDLNPILDEARTNPWAILGHQDIIAQLEVLAFKAQKMAQQTTTLSAY